jgi:hypothetical protein
MARERLRKNKRPLTPTFYVVREARGEPIRRERKELLEVDNDNSGSTARYPPSSVYRPDVGKNLIRAVKNVGDFCRGHILSLASGMMPKTSPLDCFASRSRTHSSK